MSAPSAAAVSIPELRTAEHLVLTTARLWVARRLDPDMPNDWASGFIAAGISPEGAAAFDALFETFLQAARRPIVIRCAGGAGVSPDEVRLLQAVSAAQRHQPALAALIIAGWLPPTALRCGAEALGAFARALAEARLLLPWRPDWSERRPAYSGADRGLALLQ